RRRPRPPPRGRVRGPACGARPGPAARARPRRRLQPVVPAKRGPRPGDPPSPPRRARRGEGTRHERRASARRALHPRRSRGAPRRAAARRGDRRRAADAARARRSRRAARARRAADRRRAPPPAALRARPRGTARAPPGASRRRGDAGDGGPPRRARLPRARRLMRIALVLAGPFPALRGSQVLVEQLATGLGARGHAVRLVTYGAGGDDLPGPQLARVGRDLRLVARLWRVVRREAIDVIHAHNYEAALAGLVVSRTTGRPLVYHGHNAMADELPTYFRGAAARRLARVVGRTLDAHVPRRADFCIAVSP